MAVKKQPTKKAKNEVVEEVVTEAVEETVEETTEPIIESDEVVADEIAEEVDETPVPADEVVEESGQTEVIVNVNDATPKVKTVQVKPNCNTRFYYGTQWFTLEKDQITNVPEEVKQRLQQAGKLSAI